ncbi:MAG: MMPL family transporter, partial [Acutalibacteraceae bacterium]|nr:MMPL family transporter [Acutalibacteraceae bacterium]
MKRIANFIVDKRYLVLGVMLALCIACVCMIPGVNVNTDMTKYLPDDSSMKQGMNVLAEEFPDMTTPSTVRVMFKDLTDVEKTNIKLQLSEIENVDSVTYNPDIHNKDGYTLFTVSTSYAYNTPEEVAIEETIGWEFRDKGVIYQNDDAMGVTLPFWVIVVAFALMMVVLFAMCASWFEPVLFLATIGIAIALNMGSNIMFEHVSQMTFSISSILQVVLSMDYSIILMNRYRQEKANTDNKFDAMKKALANAFSSVTSSGMTTVIGLLMLVFMSFTIGKDLGLVLSKGVLFSMLCVFTVLPVLILIFDKAVTKTTKKELHIPMGKVASFSFKARKLVAVVFV